MRRELLDYDRLDPLGYKIALELIVRHGFERIVEVPIRFRDRSRGRSKLDTRTRLDYLRHLARLCALLLRRSAGAAR